MPTRTESTDPDRKLRGFEVYYQGPLREALAAVAATVCIGLVLAALSLVAHSLDFTRGAEWLLKISGMVIGYALGLGTFAAVRAKRKKIRLNKAKTLPHESK